MSLYRNIVWYLKGVKEYTKAGYLAACPSFNPSDLDVDISGRSYLITGANNGIGRCVALALAKKGATVHMICRNTEKGVAAQNDIQDQSGNQKVHLHILDMSRPKDIVAFVEKFKNSGQPVNVLINNAGVLIGGNKRQITEDGLETTFATNTLGVHILTVGLLPVLRKTEDPRLIIVTSGGMLVQKMDIENLLFNETDPYDGMAVYSQTKRQEIVLTSLYAKLYPDIHVSSMHPGWVDTPGFRSSIPDFFEKFQDKVRTVEEGADTIIWLAISPAATKYESGLFFQDRKPVPVHLPLAWTKSSQSDEQKLILKLNELSTKYGAVW